MKHAILSLGIGWSLTAGAAAPAPGFAFEYQQNNQPWDHVACTKEPAGNGNPYDWNVTCPFPGETKRYLVHLALTYYPHTNPNGNSAYELLYWVTDRTVPGRSRSSSTTVWIHNDSQTGKAEAIRVGLGVEDGQADLKLNVVPRH